MRNCYFCFHKYTFFKHHSFNSSFQKLVSKPEITKLQLVWSNFHGEYFYKWFDETVKRIYFWRVAYILYFLCNYLTEFHTTSCLSTVLSISHYQDEVSVVGPYTTENLNSEETLPSIRGSSPQDLAMDAHYLTKNRKRR